ncbi:hypothetical protein B0H13DRAFT_1880173 [Mycena leptocephala]|nr:hypothetical protein B0H13DRAFT_1880173 [Mycena leptocephala]
MSTHPAARLFIFAMLLAAGLVFCAVFFETKESELHQAVTIGLSSCQEWVKMGSGQNDVSSKAQSPRTPKIEVHMAYCLGFEAIPGNPKLLWIRAVLPRQHASRPPSHRVCVAFDPKTWGGAPCTNVQTNMQRATMPWADHDPSRDSETSPEPGRHAQLHSWRRAIRKKADLDKASSRAIGSSVLSWDIGPGMQMGDR